MSAMEYAGLQNIVEAAVMVLERTGIEVEARLFQENW